MVQDNRSPRFYFARLLQKNTIKAVLGFQDIVMTCETLDETLGIVFLAALCRSWQQNFMQNWFRNQF